MAASIYATSFFTAFLYTSGTSSSCCSLKFSLFLFFSMGF